jgi:RAB protein geranylgeranyltransferase component A
LFKAPVDSVSEAEKLSFSRAYTLTLSPQIIYTKSKLLEQLVSSKVYRQLEFQAVGNWWILDEPSKPLLKRLPNGREDIFLDKSIDNRAKRGLMKFLKFVVDYKAHAEVWEPHADAALATFLSSHFQLPPNLQSVIAALTLSLDSPDNTNVKYALPRIARHLTSIGVFGPGFGAVVPKWGGGAEISQVACRAGAVGGGVYVLGTGIKSTENINGETLLTAVNLSNGDTVKARCLVDGRETRPSPTRLASKIIAIISSPLSSLFKSSIEGAPYAAVSVVVFPPTSVICNGFDQIHPIYIMVHSSETGECPIGQSKLLPFHSVLIKKHYVMIQLMNTYLHCLNTIEDNIPLTV